MEAIASKLVNRKTGQITLCGTGPERLWQSYAAGLVNEDIKHDVEVALRENERLKRELQMSRAMDKVRLQTLNRYRAERLDGIDASLANGPSLKDVWIGAMSVGFVLGATAMFFIALAII